MADWSSTGEAYAASFAALCAGAVDAVLDEAAARTDGRVLLDVGTGPGTVAAAAAAQGWRAAGVDAEPSMIEAAHRRHRGIPFRLGTLPDLDDPADSADAVTANFVLNHVPDARRAAGELGRVARGVVVVTIWHGVTSPLRPMWDHVLEAADVERPAEKALPPELDFGRDPDGVAGMLSESGLADVRARVVAWDYAFVPAELWAGVEGGVATVGGIFRSRDAATRRHMADAFARFTADAADDDGRVRVRHAAVLASGRPS